MKPQPNRLIRSIIALACFVAALWVVNAAGLPSRALYTGQINPDGSATAPEVDATAPNFTTLTLYGDAFELRSTRGSPVILNFWATWCAPCAIEMPELQAFHERYPDVRLIGINLSESRSVIAAWVTRGGYTFDIALDPSGEIARLYALRGQPTTIILSPGGVILQIIYGATTRAALEGALAPFLG